MEDLEIVTSMGPETNNESTEALETNQEVVDQSEVETDEVEAEVAEAPEGKPDETAPGIKKQFAKIRQEKRDMRAELEQLRAQVQASSKPVEKQYTREDFGSDEEAYLEYRIQQGLKSQMAEQTRVAQEAQKAQYVQNQALTSWQTKIDSFATELPDYAETVNAASGNLDLSQDDVQNIMESPIGPKVIYTLSTDEALSNAFLELPSQKARDRFLTKLEIKLEMMESKPAKAVSKANKPTPKISGGKDAKASGKDPASMSMDEYVKWRNGEQ